MIRILNAPDPVLSTAIKLLDSKEGSFRRLTNMVNETQPSKLVPTFSYLIFWISSNMKNINDPTESTYVNYALQLLGLIYTKVPPIIMVNGTFDLNWGILKPHWFLQEFFDSINQRITRIRSYLRPPSAFGQIIPLPLMKPYQSDLTDLKSYDFTVNMGTDHYYQDALEKHFRRLILNFAPLSAFKYYLDSKTSKEILTKAIIRILNDLNDNRQLSHYQQLTMFSHIFIYANIFSIQNDIDGQMLAEYLQTRIYISPFCALAIVSNVEQVSPLYNLLMPREILNAKDPSEVTELTSYSIYDQTFKLLDSLSNFAKLIPEIFLNYFQKEQTKKNDERPSDNLEDITTCLRRVYICQDSIYEKRKSILKHASKLSPIDVYALSSALLKIIIRNLPKLLPKFIKTLNNDLCNLFRNCYRLIFPTFTDLYITSIFPSNPQAEEFNVYKYTLIGISLYCLPLLLETDAKHTLKFIVSTLNSEMFSEDSTNYPYHIIRRYLLSIHSPISTELQPILEKCNDATILTMFIDALARTQRVHTFADREKSNRFREMLLSMTKELKPGDLELPFLEIVHFESDERFNTKSRQLLGSLRLIYDSPISFDISNLQLLLMSSKMREPDFAKDIASEIIRMLQVPRSIAEPYELYLSDYAIPFAQMAVARFLNFEHKHLAYEVLTALIEGPLITDLAKIHWLRNFVVEYRSMLDNRMIIILQEKLREWNIKVSTMNSAIEIADYLSMNEERIDLDPDDLVNEYRSPAEGAMSYSLLKVLLDTRSFSAIAAEIAEPIFQLSRAWSRREEGCLALGRLAAECSTEVSRSFFELLMKRPPTEMSMISGRLFLTLVRLDVYEQLIKECGKLIEHRDAHLDFFMRMALPSYTRMEGRPDLACEFICALLQNVNEGTPRPLQEAVLDAVGLIYVKLKLFDYRTQVITAASPLEADLRSLIAASLDTEFACQCNCDLVSNKRVEKAFSN